MLAAETIDDMNRVLIVDDDQGLVSLLQRYLRNEGFEVTAVYDHRSGLEAALRHEHDAIILDVMLPGGSGFELLKSLRPEKQMTLIIATHDAKVAASAPRVIELVDGQINQ